MSKRAVSVYDVRWLNPAVTVPSGFPVRHVANKFPDPLTPEDVEFLKERNRRMRIRKLGGKK